MKAINILVITATVFLCISILIFGCGPEMIIYHRMQGYVPNDGPLGDAFGGSLGPLVALLGAAVTFLAFWIQYQANEMQKRALKEQQLNAKKQEIDLARERFENKFYKQIELIRANTSEIEVGESTKDRKAFLSFFSELKFIYLVVDNYYKADFVQTINREITPEEIYNIAYLIFFFGVGPNSDKLVQSFLKNSDLILFFNGAKEIIKKNQSLWHVERRKGRTISVANGAGFFELSLKYKPGNGHTSKLSHYVRHLFQTIKFVHNADLNVISDEMKYDYMSIIRSQLSPHEQLFIYYNSLSVLGKPWLDNPNYLKKYCLIKSILIPIADFYKKPHQVFGTVNDDGKALFEWDEIGKRLVI